MKRLLSLLLACMMLVCAASFASAEQSTYTGTAKGFGSDVKVTVTLDGGKVVGLDVDDSQETYTLAGIARENTVDKLIAAILDQGNIDGIDATTGATFTSSAVLEVVKAALEGGVNDAPVAFTPGTYEATAEGYNGPSTFAVTFTENALTDVQVVSSTETAHVGDIAFAPMIADMIAANGSGVDAVSGATFSSRALRDAVNDAAQQAGCTNLDAFKAATVAHDAGEAVDVTYDVVIVGAGGAGIAAAAQAAQDGNTVLVIEKNP
jgi:fumarate reductase flavoprotein subunit